MDCIIVGLLSYSMIVLGFTKPKYAKNLNISDNLIIETQNIDLDIDNSFYVINDTFEYIN